MPVIHHTHLQPALDVKATKESLAALLSEGKITEKDYKKTLRDLNRYLFSFIINANKMGPRPTTTEYSRFSSLMLKEAIKLHVPTVEKSVEEAMYNRAMEQVEKLSDS